MRSDVLSVISACCTSLNKLQSRRVERLPVRHTLMFWWPDFHTSPAVVEQIITTETCPESGLSQKIACRELLMLCRLIFIFRWAVTLKSALLMHNPFWWWECGGHNCNIYPKIPSLTGPHPSPGERGHTGILSCFSVLFSVHECACI